MKSFHIFFLTGAAALVLTTAAMADTAAKPAGDAKTAAKIAHRIHHKADKAGSYKTVTFENGKKITTTYKAVGTRKVGLVGNKPFDVQGGPGLQYGGQYYTENGVRYYNDPSQKLAVKFTGTLND